MGILLLVLGLLLAWLGLKLGLASSSPRIKRFIPPGFVVKREPELEEARSLLFIAASCIVLFAIGALLIVAGLIKLLGGCPSHCY